MLSRARFPQLSVQFPVQSEISAFTVETYRHRGKKDDVAVVVVVVGNNVMYISLHIVVNWKKIHVFLESET